MTMSKAVNWAVGWVVQCALTIKTLQYFASFMTSTYGRGHFQLSAHTYFTRIISLQVMTNILDINMTTLFFLIHVHIWEYDFSQLI